MTKSTEARAIITGSFILYLVGTMLDNQKRTFKEAKRLRKILLEQTSKAQYLPYVILSNKAWADTVSNFQEENHTLVIFDAVEFLSFGEEEAMTELFGDDFMDASCEFSMRFSSEKVPNSNLHSSRIICKSLTATLKKYVFEEVK